MINRRSILKGIGAGFAGIFIAGGASYCYSLFGYLQRKPLIIGGSTAVKRFVEKLASAFVKKYQEVDLIVQGGHSYAGLIALNRGTVDLAMVSHNLKPDEDGVNLQSYLIGIEAIALVVHPNLGINNLSASNAKLIFEQKITNWHEVGGPNVPIQLFSRDFHSTARLTIEEVLLQGKSISERVKELGSAAEMVQEITLNPNGIGFLSVGEITPEVKTLRINDVEINEKTVLLNIYPLIRPLFLVNLDDLTPTTKLFLDFALSNDGQSLVSQNGASRVR